uniref:Uncharacterized protein n=1 Tax=viral metagenome TaxID=1070528 RepID=A0A6M3IR04_9ZZZZ
MPNLPRYEQKTRPVKGVAITNQPAVQRVSGMGEGFEGAQTIAATGSEVLRKWQAAQDTMDYTQAKADYETKIAQVKIGAKNDPDPDNSDAHISQVQELKKDFAAKFHNKELAQKALFELDKDISIASMEIGNEFRKKQLYQNKINLGSLVETLAAEKRATDNLAIQQEIQGKIDGVLIANVANGTITQAEARNLKTLQVRSDILSDSSVREAESDVLTKLRDSKDEEYSYLSQDERLDAIKDMQARIYQNNQSYKREIDYLHTDTAIGMAQSLVDSKLTSFDVQAALKAGTIDATTARVFTAALEKGTVPTEKEPIVAEEYLEVFDKNLKESIKAKDIIENATKEWQKGNLKDDEYAFFIQQAQKKLERERNDQPGWGKAMEAFKRGAMSILTFGLSEAPGMKMDMIKKFLERGGEKNPEEVSKEVILETQTKYHPSIDLLEETPNGVMAEDTDLDILNVNKTKLKPNYKWDSKNNKLIKVE